MLFKNSYLLLQTLVLYFVAETWWLNPVLCVPKKEIICLQSAKEHCRSKFRNLLIKNVDKLRC